MGQGPSTPQTNKTYISSFYSLGGVSKPEQKKNIFGFGNILSALDGIGYSTVKDTNLLEYIRCNYYTANEYTEIDKNLLPKHMCKIRKTVNVGDTTIKGSKDTILKKLKFNTKKHGDDLDLYQFTLNKNQLRKLEDTINDILTSFSKSVIGGKIPGPIYVAYSKVLDYNGTYIERYCKKLLNKEQEKINKQIRKNKEREKKGKSQKPIKQSETYKFFSELFKQLKSNRNIIDKTIFKRYVWKGNVDLIILIPNMNNTNRIHTNMFDYYIHNTIVDNLVNNTYMNEIIPEDISKYPKFFQRFAKNQGNFIHDSNNICELHGCSTLGGGGEALETILPNYSSDTSTMRANANQTKIYLPSKCLRPVDYVKNGYNPKGKDIRKNFNFSINVDYTDIVFDMIFCLALDCMFKTAEKKNGVANRWLNYVNKLKTNPDSLEPDELCYDHIITHMNSYVYECIKGIPPTENEDQPSLAIKPIKVKKDQYTKWNNDIMKELAKRNSQFPGIQEYIYPFFKVKTSQLNISTFNLPWGERLLKNNDFLSEDESKSFIKSHNNRYTLFVSNNGQFGVKDGNNVKLWYNSYRYNYDTYTFTIQSDCKLAIKNTTATIYLITVTDKTNLKGPLSVIIDNSGKLIIYDNGFNVIRLNKTFTISNNNFKSDIESIHKNGLWSYITGDNNNNLNNNNLNNSNNNYKYSNDQKCKWIASEVITTLKDPLISSKDPLIYNEVITEQFILNRFKRLHNIFLEK